MSDYSIRYGSDDNGLFVTVVFGEILGIPRACSFADDPSLSAEDLEAWLRVARVDAIKIRAYLNGCCTAGRLC